MLKKIIGFLAIGLTTVLTLVRLGGDADFIVERVQTPGEGAGALLIFLLNPPPLVLGLLLVGGFALLLWDQRRGAVVPRITSPAQRWVSAKNHRVFG